MNTDPKTAISSDKRASQAHPEQVLTNNKPVEHYQAMLHFTQHSQALVLIEAHSLAEAQAKAEAMNGDDVEKWEFLYDDTSVEHIELKGKGESHE